MTKSELINVVAAKTKVTKSKAELVVNCIFEYKIPNLIIGNLYGRG